MTHVAVVRAGIKRGRAQADPFQERDRTLLVLKQASRAIRGLKQVSRAIRLMEGK